MAHFQESGQGMGDLAMSPTVLSEMVSLIEGGTISGKIAKQILPDLLQVRLSWHTEARHTAA